MSIPCLLFKHFKFDNKKKQNKLFKLCYYIFDQAL